MNQIGAWMHVVAAMAAPYFTAWAWTLVVWLSVAVVIVGLALMLHPAVRSLTHPVDARSGLWQRMRPHMGRLVVATGLVLSLSALFVSPQMQQSVQQMTALSGIPKLDAARAMIRMSETAPNAIAFDAPSQHDLPPTPAATPEPLAPVVADPVPVTPSSDQYLKAAEASATDDPQRALTLYERARLYDPSNPQIWYALGSLYERLDKSGAARVAFDRAARLAGHQGKSELEARALGRLGRQQQLTQDFEGARTSYGAALSLNETLGREDGVAANLFALSILDRTEAAADVHCDQIIADAGFVSAYGIDGTDAATAVGGQDCMTGNERGRAARRLAEWLNGIEAHDPAQADVTAHIDEMVAPIEAWEASRRPSPDARAEQLRAAFGFDAAPVDGDMAPATTDAVDDAASAVPSVASLLGFAPVADGTATMVEPVADPIGPDGAVNADEPVAVVAEGGLPLDEPLAVPARPDDAAPETEDDEADTDDSAALDSTEQPTN